MPAPYFAVTITPSLEVFDCRQTTGFLVVAGLVSQNKIMAEVHGVTRPGDEVVHIQLLRKGTQEIEAIAFLVF